MSSVSILLVASQETFRLKRSVRDLERAQVIAAAEGHQVTISTLPYRTSEETRAWLEHYAPSEWKILRSEEQGLSSSISAWAAGNSSEQLGVIGTEESVSGRWLAECASRQPHRCKAWHPEALVTYGPNFFDRGEMSLIAMPPRIDKRSASSAVNPLPASFIASRESLSSYSYPDVDPARSWGEEGWTPLMRWWWVNRLLVAGVEFEAVPGCTHFRAMPDGEGPEILLTPSNASRMGPFLKEAPRPSAAPRFQGWPLPERQGPSRMMPRDKHKREMEDLRGYLKQVEEARDWFRDQSQRWEAEARRLAAL
ncbi:hypothetical protein [Sabulicella glaciei]|uniref:Uncharacterized protein n=1 Tax=Sabulicella glaciei TaxID=2984948 RepID=A0ABT3NZB9_9PROT|nr:hypothetical protein [Roseococcus sp. MDT2-1-1]MCW8087501.1 hypothetical protein [Roseococcus sp. MDT2-1-1]